MEIEDLVGFIENLTVKLTHHLPICEDAVRELLDQFTGMSPRTVLINYRREIRRTFVSLLGWVTGIWAKDEEVLVVREYDSTFVQRSRLEKISVAQKV